MANKKKNTPEIPAEEIEKQETSTEETAEPEQEAPADETAAEPEQITPETESNETSCPYEATVSVALAVLRKSIGPGTAEMLKPVATLKQGTKITITDVQGENARLANGLWIALEYTTR